MRVCAYDASCALILSTHLLELVVMPAHRIKHRGRHDVGQVVLLARLLYDLGEGWVVNVVHRREEVMLDLEVEPSTEVQ